MDGDAYIFDLFLETIEHLENNSADGRLRMLSKDPRYAADDPAQSKPTKTHIEKR